MVGNIETGATRINLVYAEAAPVGIVCCQYPVLAIAQNMWLRESFYEGYEFGE
jgi:hypothetical protein